MSFNIGQMSGSQLCSLKFSVKVLFVSSLARRKAFSADVSRAYG